jgi:hypothetical protein
MSITLFGTCRIDNINLNNNLNNLLNYTHCTKEVIQFINFLKGKLIIPPPYNILCFRSALCNNIGINFIDFYNKLFNETRTFIIEICSRKKYIHNGFYMHHLPFDKILQKVDNNEIRYFINNTPKYILNNYTIEIQSDEEIENDILAIKKLLYPKKIIIVSHYNSKLNGEYLNSRNNLINLLEKICLKYNISFINPTEIFSNYSQEDIMRNDLGHYTDLGREEFIKYLNNYINNLI